MSVEYDLAAAATLAANFGESHIHDADIATIPDSEIPEADLIIGGPPCQGFSNLSSRNVEDPRNKLWKEYIRFVQHAKPKVFVIENVDRFSPPASLRCYRLKPRLAGELSAGFLLAAEFGVPQRRKRTIVIGYRIGRISLPDPTHSPPGTLSKLLEWHTTCDVLAGLPEHPAVTDLPQSRVSFFDEELPGIFKSSEVGMASRDQQRGLPCLTAHRQ